MKKTLIALTSAALVAATAVSLAGCGSKGPVKVIDVELTTEEYAFAIAKDNTSLLTTVNEYIAEIKDNGELDKIINSYFDGSATFTYTNKTTTAASGDFVVATNAYFPPFESYDKNSAFYGVDIEIAYNISQKLNKNLFVYDMDFDAIIPSVQNGESAIGMAGMTVSETRLEQVNFATPYYASAQVIVVREDDTTFDGCKTAEEVEAILNGKNSKYKIGTQAGTTGYMYSAGDDDFGYDGFPVKTQAYNTGALAMTDLSNGKINAVILDKQPSLMISAKINEAFTTDEN